MLKIKLQASRCSSPRAGLVKPNIGRFSGPKQRERISSFATFENITMNNSLSGNNAWTANSPPAWPVADSGTLCSTTNDVNNSSERVVSADRYIPTNDDNDGYASQHWTFLCCTVSANLRRSSRSTRQMRLLLLLLNMKIMSGVSLRTNC